MLSLRHILRELRAPMAGLTILAVVVMTFAAGLVTSAQATGPARFGADCISSDAGQPLDRPDDMLCTLSCALGAAAMFADLPPPVPVALVRSADDAPVPVAAPAMRRVFALPLGGGGARAPPARQGTASFAVI